MNTDPTNPQTRAGTTLHPEQAAPATNRIGIYEVAVHITQYRVGYVLVSATSHEEARRAARFQEVETSWVKDSEVDIGQAELLTEFTREEEEASDE